MNAPKGTKKSPRPALSTVRAHRIADPFVEKLTRPTLKRTPTYPFRYVDNPQFIPDEGKEAALNNLEALTREAIALLLANPDDYHCTRRIDPKLLRILQDQNTDLRGMIMESARNGSTLHANMGQSRAEELAGEDPTCRVDDSLRTRKSLQKSSTNQVNAAKLSREARDTLRRLQAAVERKKGISLSNMPRND